MGVWEEMEGGREAREGVRTGDTETGVGLHTPQSGVRDLGGRESVLTQYLLLQDYLALAGPRHQQENRVSVILSLSF